MQHVGRATSESFEEKLVGTRTPAPNIPKVSEAAISDLANMVQFSLKDSFVVSPFLSCARKPHFQARPTGPLTTPNAMKNLMEALNKLVGESEVCCNGCFLVAVPERGKTTAPAHIRSLGRAVAERRVLLATVVSARLRGSFLSLAAGTLATTRAESFAVGRTFGGRFSPPCWQPRGSNQRQCDQNSSLHLLALRKDRRMIQVTHRGNEHFSCRIWLQGSGCSMSLHS